MDGEVCSPALDINKGENGWESLCGQYWFQVILFVVLSFMEYVTIETFLQGDICQIGWEYSIKNVMLLMAANLLLLSLTRWLRLTFLLSGVFVFVLGLANYFVDAFRGYGIVYMDIYAAGTAANVAGDYSYHWDWMLLLGIILGVLMLILCVLATPKRSRKRSLRSGIAMVAGVAVSVGFFVWINFGYTFWDGINNLTWDHSIGMSEYGYLLYVTANAGQAKVEEPEGYSVRRADEILSRYQDPQKTNSVLASHAGSAKAPHLIIVMNESFSDLRVLEDFVTNQPYLSFFDSLEDNTIRGFAESSVYGGYTANSEFEFLTGCTKAFLPGNPFLQYISDEMPSIISNIKAQDKYGKAVAVHPYNPSGYNRNRVYPLLSIDEFLDIDDFKNPVKVRKYISDQSDYEMLERLYEEREKGSSLCLFNVTMQNHSSYDYQGYTFASPVKLTYETLQPQAEQYLSLVKMSDDALKELITYFKGVDEPVLITVFGDHQPHLPDYFYKRIMGQMPDDLSHEDSMKRYLIPFAIWANYDISEAVIERTSINYLSTLMMETAGLELTDFQRFLLDMYQYVPSVSANGYYDNEGKLHSWEEETAGTGDMRNPAAQVEKNQDGEKMGEPEVSGAAETAAKWMEEYRIVQYNYIFDKENRLDKHFQLD